MHITISQYHLTGMNFIHGYYINDSKKGGIVIESQVTCITTQQRYTTVSLMLVSPSLLSAFYVQFSSPPVSLSQKH